MNMASVNSSKSNSNTTATTRFVLPSPAINPLPEIFYPPDKLLTACACLQWINERVSHALPRQIP